MSTNRNNNQSIIELTATPEAIAYLEQLQQSGELEQILGCSVYIEIEQQPVTTSENVINVKKWLEGQIDELTQNLYWIVFPPSLESAMGNMRSSPDIAAIEANLRQKNLIIPQHNAVAVNESIVLGEWELIVYAWVWWGENQSDWEFLVMLGAKTQELLPKGLQLEIKQTDEIIQRLITEDERFYLYSAPISGKERDEFQIAITLNQPSNYHEHEFTFQF